MIKVSVTMTVAIGTSSDPYCLNKQYSGLYLFGDSFDENLIRHAGGDGWTMGFVTELPPYIEDGMVVMPEDVTGHSTIIPLDRIAGAIDIVYRKVTDAEEKALREKVGKFCEENKEGVQVVSTTNAQGPVGHGG